MAAYGRLDVYRPESPIETYPLEKATVGVGRQPGNDITIDTAGVSRYHFTLELRGEAVYLVDKESQNGTYVDGVRIKADEPHPLREGEEIQVGDARIVFHSAAQSDIPTGEQQATTTSEPTYSLEIEDADLSVTPGAHSQTILKIRNTGTEPDTYTVQVDGIPKEWMRLDRLEIDIPPGMGTSAVLSIKPLRRPDSAPGNYTLTVKLLSKAFPLNSVEAPITLHMLSYGGFGMVLGTPRVSEGQPVELFTQNQGSGQLPLIFVGHDPAQRLTFEFQPASVTLGPGEKRTVRAYIHPKKRRYFGARSDTRFDMVAQSRDPSGFQVPVSGTFADAPRLPTWFPLAALAAIGAVIVAAILFGGLIVFPTLANRSITPSATTTLTVTVGPSVTPIQVVIPTFTPPASETPTLPPEPTLPPAPTLPTLTPSDTLATPVTPLAPTVELPTLVPATTPVGQG